MITLLPLQFVIYNTQIVQQKQFILLLFFIFVCLNFKFILIYETNKRELIKKNI